MTYLVIIGAGAAGLMAACAAGERKLNCILLEKRHRPGLKLLMCGNNRCNISHRATAENMLSAYGEHSGNFLKKAIKDFTPQDLQNWFQKNGVQTSVIKDRIYPRSEKADDVLHCFTDRLRDFAIPFCTNCGVRSIEKIDGAWRVKCDALSIDCKNIVIATGGISYPKTGSTGDVTQFAEQLELKTAEWKTALGAIDANSRFFYNKMSTECNHFPVKIKILNGETKIGETLGNLLLYKAELSGSAIFDAVRLGNRADLKHPTFVIDLFPELPERVLAQKLAAQYARIKSVKGCLNAIGLDHGYCESLEPLIENAMAGGDTTTAAKMLKSIELNHFSIHPAKEAIACIGGIELCEINPETMEAINAPGIYFAGECIDAEGPTGGFNLHAAFATARLAIASIAQSANPPKIGHDKPTRNKPEKPAQERQKSTKGKSSQKSAWGKDFWKQDKLRRR